MALLGCCLVGKWWSEVIFFLGATAGVFFVYSGSSVVFKVSEIFELDFLGFSLVSLSIWIGAMCLMGSVKLKAQLKHNALFVLVNGFLVFFLILSFSFCDYLLFYLSFESCLVPILLLILGWGYQPERAQAGMYMLFYTLFGSLPLFYVVMVFSYGSGSGGMFFGLDPFVKSNIFFLFMISAFLIKFPMYSSHLWLLKAHVEAPVAGSMVLAGVLLKLGGYGLVRVLPLLKDSLWLIELVVGLCLWGGFVVSLECLRQMDMKLLVASSSVVHMSGCIGGLFILSEMGYKGSVGMMIAHGLCSSGLFYMVNLVYERTHSRSMLVSKGLLNLMPSMSLWWFFLVSSNMSAPPTINLLSEILLIISLISWSMWSLVGLSLMSFFTAGYSLYLFSLSQHGVYMLSKSGFSSGTALEFLVVSLHWLPLNLLIISFFYVL